MIRKRGRPSLDPAVPSVSLHLTLTTKQYDALYQASRTLRRSVQEVIRRTLSGQARPEFTDGK